MTKTHLENTKHDERWLGNNKKTMSTKNGEIATNNNSKEGHQKATLKGPYKCQVGLESLFLGQKGSREKH
jgi:hypothetical protein